MCYDYATMTQSLKDKIAIITGGSRGIGASVAKLFASEGAKVVICATDKAVLEEQSLSIKEETGNKNILPLTLDLSKTADIEMLFEETDKVFGKCDIFINNASVINTDLIEDVEDETLSNLLDVNVKAPILCCKYAFKAMKEKGGTIINVSSLSGIKGVEKFPGLSSYIASKFAIVGLTEALSVEGRPYNIRVNCIAPGGVDTRMVRTAFPNFTPVTVPDDISPTFLFLADESKSRKLTGEVIEIHCNT
jgi:NAD(P)-dependent dehydrogenase (short-subunit alcohol dehydrogenase family)